MSLGKKQYEQAYKRENKRIVEERIQDDYDSAYNDDWYDYWNDVHCYDCDHCQGPTLRDIAIGKLLTVLSKLRVRGTKAILDEWDW